MSTKLTLTNQWELQSEYKLNTIWLFRVISDNWGDDLIAKIIKKYIRNHLPTIEIREVSVKEKVTQIMLSEINKSVAVILGGSGLFVNYPKLASGFYWNIPIGYIDKINVPIFIIGVGTNDNYQLSNYGDFTEVTKTNIGRLLDKSSMIWVRDTNTHKKISKLTNKEIITGYCPSLNSFQIFGGYSELGYSQIPIISVSFGKHGNYVKSKWNELIKFYSDLISKILKDTDCMVYHVKHRNVDWDGYQDVKNMLQENLKARYIFVELHDTRQQLFTYSKCITNISMYLHSSIISSSAGVPVQMIGYDIKCETFYYDIISKISYTSFQSLECNLNYKRIFDNIKLILENPYLIKWRNREIINRANHLLIEDLFMEIGIKLLEKIKI